ncbi:hypothetical protein BH20ACI1_BH20ACI1_03530 [soil metagenome]
MKKFAGSLVMYIGIALFVAIGITQCVEVSKDMPDNAFVLVDDKQQLYHSPIHFRDDKENKPADLREIRFAEAKASKYKPDPTCRSEGYFSHERGSLLRATLSDWFGLAGKPRWNEDGSWNW